MQLESQGGNINALHEQIHIGHDYLAGLLYVDPSIFFILAVLICHSRGLFRCPIHLTALQSCQSVHPLSHMHNSNMHKIITLLFSTHLYARCFFNTETETHCSFAISFFMLILNNESKGTIQSSVQFSSRIVKYRK